MKLLLKLEELVMALVCLYGLYLMNPAWWWFLLFLLGPDISFLGYLFGNKIGAVVYNLAHHKGVALVVLAIGYLVDERIMLMSGIVMLGHSSMDRFFGYGLKLFEGFKFTHLGHIGNK